LSRSIFVTATDTDAGKTWVTACLLRAHLEKGTDIQALKPVASGVNQQGINDDVAALLAEQQHKQAQDINFITYTSAVAPALAAQKQHASFCEHDLSDWLNQQRAKHEMTLIEGIGGLMAPLSVQADTSWLVSDWLQSMADVDVMLVVPLRLGCMNHTLLSCKHLESMGKFPRWIVFNDRHHTDSFNETMSILRPILQSMFNNESQFIHLAYGGQKLPAL